jgi:bifunctional non-homologous end joining protein LigD
MLFTPIKPMLLTNHKVTPFSLTDPDLLYEPKYDGWRLLLHKEGARVEIYTRHGNVVTDRFPEFVATSAGIQAHSVILDCEGVCFPSRKEKARLWYVRGKSKVNKPN